MVGLGAQVPSPRRIRRRPILGRDARIPAPRVRPDAARAAARALRHRAAHDVVVARGGRSRSLRRRSRWSRCSLSRTRSSSTESDPVFNLVYDDGKLHRDRPAARRARAAGGQSARRVRGRRRRRASCACRRSAATPAKGLLPLLAEQRLHGRPARRAPDVQSCRRGPLDGQQDARLPARLPDGPAGRQTSTGARSSSCPTRRRRGSGSSSTLPEPRGRKRIGAEAQGADQGGARAPSAPSRFGRSECRPPALQASGSTRPRASCCRGCRRSTARLNRRTVRGGHLRRAGLDCRRGTSGGTRPEPKPARRSSSGRVSGEKNFRWFGVKPFQRSRARLQRPASSR